MALLLRPTLALLVGLMVLRGHHAASEAAGEYLHPRPEGAFFEYDVELVEQPSRGLGVQLDDNLAITAFAPSSALQDTGEPRVGDQLLSIAGTKVTSVSLIRGLLREGEYPLTVRLRAAVTKDRSCVAPPKGGRLVAGVLGDADGPVYFDYLAADFTTAAHLARMQEEAEGEVGSGDGGGGSAEVVLADPAHACYDDIKNAEDVVGKVVLVTRGRCSFVKKIEYMERLGARGVVVSNDGSGLLHIPTPPLGGSRRQLPSIPAVMITSQAGQALRKMVVAAAADSEAEAATEVASSSGSGHRSGSSAVRVKLEPEAEVSHLWKEVSPLLVSSAAWPEEAADRKRRYRKLSQVHHPDKPRGSKDRFAAIAEAYKKANYELDPEVQAEYKGIDDYMANA